MISIVTIEEGMAEDTDKDTPSQEAQELAPWGWAAMPMMGANTTDGWGVGIAAQVFRRPDDGTQGYKTLVTSSFWTSLDLGFSAGWVEVTHHGPVDVLARTGLRQWQGVRYAGSGGESVMVHWDEKEDGGTLLSPFWLVGVSKTIGNSPVAVFSQYYGRYVHSEPRTGSMLADLKPLGHEGAVYMDLSLGLAFDKTDRWPLPRRGYRGEVSIRGGGTMTFDPEFHGLFGMTNKWMAWWDFGTPWTVFGVRWLLDKTFGERPFFEQELMGGWERAEIGSDRVLGGYGRTRTRGDGVAAVMVEYRPRIFSTKHPFWRVAMDLSIFAEEAFLFDKDNPGPHMPSVGMGLIFLWQDVAVLRPFAVLGWRNDAPGAERYPDWQFGLSFGEPL